MIYYIYSFLIAWFIIIAVNAAYRLGQMKPAQIIDPARIMSGSLTVLSSGFISLTEATKLLHKGFNNLADAAAKLGDINDE